MTLWWVERERDGEWGTVVSAAKDARERCLGYMLAVGDCQPGDRFRLCKSATGGERQVGEREVVDEYTPPSKASEADGTVWWIERRDEDGWQMEVHGTDDYRYCWGFMDAVVRLRSDWSYAMFQNNGDGKPRMVRRYVGRDRRRGDVEASEPLATDGEWRTGPCKTNDGRPCVILEVHDDGRLSWAFPTALAWVAHCDHPGTDGHHPARPVREVVQRYRVDTGGVYWVSDDSGVEVCWKISGGKLVGVELLEADQ